MTVVGGTHLISVCHVYPEHRTTGEERGRGGRKRGEKGGVLTAVDCKNAGPVGTYFTHRVLGLGDRAGGEEGRGVG